MEGAVVEAVLPAAAALQRHEVAVLLLHLREGSMIKAVAVLLLRLREGSMIEAIAVLLVRLREGSMIKAVAILRLRDGSMTRAVHAHAAVLHTAFPRLEVVLRRGRGVYSMVVEGAVHSIEVGRAVISMKVEGVVNEVERAAAAAASIITPFHAASVHERQKQAVKAHEA